MQTATGTSRESINAFLNRLRSDLSQYGIDLLNPDDPEWFHVCRAHGDSLIACVPLLSAAFCKSKSCEEKLTFALECQRNSPLERIVPIVYENDVHALMKYQGRVDSDLLTLASRRTPLSGGLGRNRSNSVC